MASLLPSLWGNPEDRHAPITSLQREIDKVFNEFSRGFGMPRVAQGTSAEGSLFSPSMDVIEKDNALEVTTELPGVGNDDIEVTIVDDVLTIRGEKKAENKEEKDDYHVVERSYGAFKRSLRLPFKVSAEEIDASFKDGVLKVTLPKPPETAARTQKVAIRSTG